MLGGLYMGVAMFLAAGIDVAVKLLTETFATSQIVFLRTLLAVPLLLLMCWWQGALAGLFQPLWGWQVYRGLLAAGANFGFFYALEFLPLVTAVMLAYVAPVFVVLFARPLLGERVGWRRAAGVGLGFLGVVVVLQPSPTSFAEVAGPASLAVVASALCWALLSVSNRQLRGRVDPAVLAFYTAPLSGLLGWWFIGADWVPPSPEQWGLFATAAGCGAGAHYCAAQAYRHAEAVRIAPLEYTNLLWASLAGWLLWQELASASVWAGGALVVLGGYIALRARSGG